MSTTAVEFKRVRALAMIQAKIMENLTYEQLAERFHCSKDTVERTLAWARKADILSTYEDKIINDLVPKAYTALLGALEEGNAKIALEIFKGTNLLRTPGSSTPAQKQNDDDLAAYISAKRNQDLLEAETIDGELTDANPPAIEGHGTKGLLEAAPGAQSENETPIRETGDPGVVSEPTQPTTNPSPEE